MDVLCSPRPVCSTVNFEFYCRYAYTCYADAMFGLERRLCTTLLCKVTNYMNTSSQMANRGLKNELKRSQSEPVDPKQIKSFLVDHGIPHTKRYTCLTATCPKFRKGKLKLKAVDQLYINDTTGTYVNQSPV